MGVLTTAEDDLVLGADDIRRRVVELGEQISADYAGRDLLLVGVLGEAALFTADLVRALTVPTGLDWLAVAARASGRGRSGTVRLTKDLDGDPARRDVLLVEAIMDTGLTLAWLTARLAERQPRSIATCVLLRTPAARARADAPRYVGFDITHEIGTVGGYGLGPADRHRALPEIRTMPAPVALSRRSVSEIDVRR
ncbi:phosphoribosyltransferase [Couchioplanes caeruleus]|uniref:Hypoxanthine-guanine phosphoribosyltransferase n=2 Tax=Couchioplanes caeruleus TaxID=56438 RepID=A0A1K0GKL3_9ACTN|nr:phosphoribosyltransferase family protein [Couchioplanes caeruleus]OJF12822.1 hypothetical protein BG844_18580 [Couchioplanes caeruleus subsp. caeruleus]ROP30672.1 hypoxanthine phosphoribosyltransferase [Couchioplanes caeruleus]